MKELSIEEKEALERYKAKQEYEYQKVHEFIEYLFPELKKQKPAWSERDELMLEASISFIKSSPYPYFGDTLRGEISKIEVEDWLKYLKDKTPHRPKQKWSEEDEVMIKVFDSIIRYIVEVVDKDALERFGTKRE